MQQQQHHQQSHLLMYHQRYPPMPRGGGEWAVPRWAMCVLFWLGDVLIFAGVILLIVGSYKAQAPYSAGWGLIGLGVCLFFISLAVCIRASWKIRHRAHYSSKPQPADEEQPLTAVTSNLEYSDRSPSTSPNNPVTTVTVSKAGSSSKLSGDSAGTYESDSGSSSEYVRVIQSNKSNISSNSSNGGPLFPLCQYEHTTHASPLPSSPSSSSLLLNQQQQQRHSGVPIKRVVDVAIASEEHLTMENGDNALTASQKSSVENVFVHTNNPESSSHLFRNGATPAELHDSFTMITMNSLIDHVLPANSREADGGVSQFKLFPRNGMQFKSNQQLLHVVQPRYPDLSDIDEERECSSRDSMGGAIESTCYSAADASELHRSLHSPASYRQQQQQQQQQQQASRVTDDEITDVQNFPTPTPTRGISSTVHMDYGPLTHSPSHKLFINPLSRPSANSPPQRTLPVSSRRKLASPPQRRLANLSSPQPRSHRENPLLRMTSSDVAMTSLITHVSPPEVAFYRSHSASSKTSSQSADGSFNSEPASSSSRFARHQYSF